MTVAAPAKAHPDSGSHRLDGETGRALRIERRPDAVAVLWFDLPAASHNTLDPELAPELSDCLSALESDAAVDAVVFASAKPDSFVVGGSSSRATRAGRFRSALRR